MRSAPALFVLCAGCHSVFGLNEVGPPDGASDTPIAIDASGSGTIVVQSLFIDGSTIHTNEVHEVSATLVGAPNAPGMFELTTTGGFVDPAGARLIALDANGTIVVPTTFQAPNVVAPVTLVGKATDAGGASTMLGLHIDVHGELVVGTDEFTGSTVNQASDKLFIQRVQLDQPGTVTALGYWANSQVVVRMGIYDGGGTLVAATAPTMAASGRQVFDVTPKPLDPGLYYIAIGTTGTNAFYWMFGSGEHYELPTNMGVLPSMLNAGQAVPNGLCLFAIVDV